MTDASAKESDCSLMGKSDEARGIGVEARGGGEEARGIDVEARGLDASKSSRNIS